MAKIEPEEIIEQNIKNWNIPRPDKDYKVVVQCSTYNHEKYIEDALKGFIMQKTNFSWCVLVTDDCSTDGTADIVRKYASQYPDIIKAICLGYNHMQIGISRDPYIRPWHEKGKFFCFCEGDDYWTDPLKLQKQVDFLESHPDYSMCFHTAIQHWEDGRKPDEVFRQIEDREYTGEELFKTWTAATASVMLRRSVIESDIYKRARQNKKFIYGDIITWLSAAHEGKVWGMSDVMSVYRRQETGAVFKYDLTRIKKQAYHSLEIYKVFGKQYKEISKLKFFQNAQEAFFGQKANGKIDYSLLWDLVKYTPTQTYKRLFSMVTDKIRKQRGDGRRKPEIQD